MPRVAIRPRARGARSPGRHGPPATTNATAPTNPAPKTAHATVCHTALPHRASATGPYQRSHAARRSAISRSPIPATRTSLPGAAVVAVTNRWRASRFAGAPRSSAARSTPGRHAEASTVGRAKTATSASSGWTDMSNATVTTESKDPSARGEERHVHVIEHEHLVAKHREPVQVVGAFVVLDGGDRRLELGHVRFERDGHPVAKPPLRAIARDAKEPGRGRRDAQADRRGQREPSIVGEHPIREELQPEREECVGHRRDQRESERDHQQPRFGLVGPLQGPPHGGEAHAADRHASTS